METDIYKPPLSKLVSSGAVSRPPKSARKYLVFAFLLAPLASSFAFVTTFALIEFESEYIQYAVGLFIFVSLITYVCVLVFGLPLHWALGVADWRRSYIYICVGAAIPAVVGLFFGLASEPVLWSALSAKGAFCSAVFWLIAVYLYEKKPTDRRAQSDQQKAKPFAGG